MPNGNGDRNERLDRIERALELMIADHEAFRQEHKQLLTARVLQKEQIDEIWKAIRENTRHIAEQDRQIAELRAHGKDTDIRIDKLVSAMAR